MSKVSNFIVRYSKIIFLLFIAFTICCGWLMAGVSINTDMSQYLPNDSPTKAGIEIMNDEFPAASTFNLLFEGLNDADSVLWELSEIDYVSGVSYDTTEKYNKDGYALFVVTINAAAGSRETETVITAVKDAFSTHNTIISGDAAGNTAIDILPRLAGLAFLIIFIILLFMCKSWIEPLIFLFTIGVAVVLNMGTNIIFESVSSITNAIAAILQLVLSMDYSIMMLNRYRQEKEQSENKLEAMTKAIKGAFMSITSSSATTIVGMLALVFMSFTIGRDMGFVLAKGVFFSLLCIFTVLPALLLMFDRIIEKTAKKALHIKMDKIGAASYRIRYAVPVIFVALFAASFFLRGVGISYTLTDYYKANQIFTIDNPIVILYESHDETEIAPLVESWETAPGVIGVNAYASTLGRAMSYEEIASVANINEAMAAQIFYAYLDGRGELPEQKITLGELMVFIQTDVMHNPQFASYFTPEVMMQFSATGTALDPNMMAHEFSVAEFAAMFQMDEAMAKQLFYYHAISTGKMLEVKIPLYDFMQYLINNVAENPAFATVITDAMKVELDAVKADMDDGLNQLVGKSFSRVIINTSLPEESDETFTLIRSIEQDLKVLSGQYYIFGNSIIAYEMNGTFPEEMNRITILTVIAIFLVVAIAFRSFSMPIILVCVIQCAVFFTMGIAYLQGSAMYYLALLIVQCLLLGATVDYGIFLSSYYREGRKTLEKKEAIMFALNNSIHTILTSGLILVIVTSVLGVLFRSSDPAISEILITISTGGFCAMILVVFFLPGLLVAFDRFVIKRKIR